jgi:hypothetical protein
MPGFQRRRHSNVWMPAALGAKRAKHVVAKPRCARGKKFFGSFFQKRTSFLSA